MKKLAKVFITICVFICIALDVWYFCVLRWGKEKIISSTYEVGAQTIKSVDPETGEITEDSKYFCEVNIFDDCYEIKFNYMLDEKQEVFYSQGLQFYLTGPNTLEYYMNENYTNESFTLYGMNIDYTKLNYSILEDSDKKSEKKVVVNPFHHEFYSYYDRILNNKSYIGLEVKNYASSDDYNNPIISTNPLSGTSSFKIQINNEIYLMSMKNDDLEFLKSQSGYNFYLGTSTFFDKTNNYFVYLQDFYNVYDQYRVCDVYYLAELIYNSCKNMQATSSSQTITFEFGNLFNYYKYEDGQYSSDALPIDKASIITENIKSYYQILVHKFNGSISSSSQSLFNSVNGSANYETNDENITYDDYYFGKTLFDLTQKNLSLQATQDGSSYLLKLDDNFKKYHAQGSVLRINVDLGYFESMGVVFGGFYLDSFDGYIIYKIYTIQTIDGEIVKNEVIL